MNAMLPDRRPENLTVAEERRLSTLEGELIVALGSARQNAEKIGEILAAIKQERLYRKHGTWQDYCQTFLGRSRWGGDRLITLASISKRLRPLLQARNISLSSRQAEELSRLLPPGDELSAEDETAIAEAEAVLADVVGNAAAVESQDAALREAGKARERQAPVDRAAKKLAQLGKVVKKAPPALQDPLRDAIAQVAALLEQWREQV